MLHHVRQDEVLVLSRPTLILLDAPMAGMVRLGVGT
jgi:hypothetical protein